MGVRAAAPLVTDNGSIGGREDGDPLKTSPAFVGLADDTVCLGSSLPFESALGREIDAEGVRAGSDDSILSSGCLNHSRCRS